MTIFLPLNEHARNPQIPAFLSRVTEPATYIADVVKAILKAKRVAVVCGENLEERGVVDCRILKEKWKFHHWDSACLTKGAS